MKHRHKSLVNADFIWSTSMAAVFFLLSLLEDWTRLNTFRRADRTERTKEELACLWLSSSDQFSFLFWLRLIVFMHSFLTTVDHRYLSFIQKWKNLLREIYFSDIYMELFSSISKENHGSSDFYRLLPRLWRIITCRALSSILTWFKK